MRTCGSIVFHFAKHKANTKISGNNRTGIGMAASRATPAI
jgi:hypothetical protein